MPITKTVQIGNKPVMVRELTMEELLTLFEEPDDRAVYRRHAGCRVRVVSSQ